MRFVQELMDYGVKHFILKLKVFSVLNMDLLLLDMIVVVHMMKDYVII